MFVRLLIAGLATCRPSVGFRHGGGRHRSFARRFGLEAPQRCKPYLNMPPNDRRRAPALLSQTGAFKDVRKLAPVDGLIPYDLHCPLLVRRGGQARWVALPAPGIPGAENPTVSFSPTGEWAFPAGTVFVKHFEMPTDAAHPDLKRRLETRLLVRDDAGGVYGVSYRWRPDNSDADRVDEPRLEPIEIKDVARDGPSPPAPTHRTGISPAPRTAAPATRRRPAWCSASRRANSTGRSSTRRPASPTTNSAPGTTPACSSRPSASGRSPAYPRLAAADDPRATWRTAPAPTWTPTAPTATARRRGRLLRRPLRHAAGQAEPDRRPGADQPGLDRAGDRAERCLAVGPPGPAHHAGATEDAAAGPRDVDARGACG